MTKYSKILLLISLAFVSGCSQVLQTVNLKINAEDNLEQEKFNVVAKTLTIKEARAQKSAAYPRTVIQNGRGENAGLVTEKTALLSKFPKSEEPKDYLIGIGDTIKFSRLIENNRSKLEKGHKWPTHQVLSEYKLGIGDILALKLIKDYNSINQMPSGDMGNQNLIINSQQNGGTIDTEGRIGSDGSVLLLEVGRLEAEGKSLNELRSEVRNILIRNGVTPRFQLEIVEFKSQRAYLTSSMNTEVADEKLSSIIILNDQKTTLVDVLTSAGYGFVPGVITRVKLQRENNTYLMNLREIFGEDVPEIVIMDQDHIFVEDSSANIVSNSSIVDYEGSVVFETVGKIKVAGLSLDETRSKIKSLMQAVPDSQNAFQIQVENFASHTAFVNIPDVDSFVVNITNKPKILTEVLTQSGLRIDNDQIVRINLQRNGNSYSFTLDDLLNPDYPTVYLKSGDRVTASILSYKANKVFILGGVSPQVFLISPASRETLADALFTAGGALSTPSAKRSEVYLLRGTNPVVAYHLDAQSPTRLIVAEEMELRPNDILYVAEQPIISFNRTLATIVPLRILLRDIQDDSIP